MKKVSRFPQHGDQLNVGNSIPVNTFLPTLSGTGQVGKSLTWDNGIWTNATNYTYQLNRNGTPIAGVTSAPYIQTAADIGQQLTVSVTASNGYGPATATNIISPFGIYTSTLAGTNDILLLADGTHEINHAHLSPNGAFISFVRYYATAGNPNPPFTEGSDYRNTEICLLEVATGIVTVLIAHDPTIITANPVWWPDMSQLIFITTNTITNPGKAGIGVYTFSPGLPNTAGTFSVLYNPVDTVSDPHVNSNATAIVISKDTNIGGGVSLARLFIYNVATTAVTALTTQTI